MKKNITKLRCAINSTHGLFVLIAGIFGVLLVISVPAMMGIDELYHFNRVVQFSQGQLQAIERDGKVGGMIPKAVADYEWKVVVAKYSGEYKDVGWNRPAKEAYQVPMDGSERMEAFPGAAAYNPLPYLPAIPIIAVLDGLNVNLGLTVVMARLGMLVAFIAIVALSLYILRQYRIRWLFFVIALLPKVIFQAATISADTMAIAASFLMFALIYKWLMNRHLDNRSMFLMWVCVISLPLIKFNYFPLVLIALPALASNNMNVIKSSLRYRQVVRYGLILLAIVIPTALWTLSVSHYANSNSNKPPLVEGVDSTVKGKIKFILEDPVRATLLLPRTLVENGQDSERDYIQTMIGDIGFNTVRTPTIITILASLLMVAAAWYARGELSVVKINKVFIWGVVLSVVVTVLGIFGILYVTWTSAGSLIVEGVQGRYFIPVLIPALILIAYSLPIGIEIKKEAVFRIFATGMALSLFVAVIFYVIGTYSFNF